MNTHILQPSQQKHLSSYFVNCVPKIQYIISHPFVRKLIQTITLMNGILTLQSISEIDTFTLEQKIQQLQLHPHVAYYQQLIAIAKLELEERYKVEEFGRMLINDEIPMFPIETGIKSQKQLDSKKIMGKNSSRKIEFAECLKRSLIPAQDLVIGKPTLGNYRYVPPKQPANTVREKKASVTESKKNQNLFSKRSTDKKSINLPKIPTITNLKAQKIDIKLKPLQKQLKKVQSHIKSEVIIKSQPILQTIAIQNQIKPIQKEIKKAEQKPVIKYIENDVYDGEKLVLDCPQKLAEINFDTDISVSQEREEDILEENSIVEEVKQEKQEKIQQFDNQLQIKQEISLIDHEQKQKFKLPDSKTDNLEEILKKQEKIIHTTDSKFQINDGKYQLQKNKIEVPSLPIQNKTKSISHTVVIAKSSRNLGSYDRDSDQLKQPDHVTIPVFNPQAPQKTKIQNKTMINFTKQRKTSLNEPQKPLLFQAVPVYFPYNQIIPSFNKLFPHSTNLLNDLRSIEKQLCDHLNKKINQLSQTDEYLRIRQNQLLFKVISQSEKANKYSHIFDISLDSFIQRSKTMVNRIKKHTSQQTKDQTILLYRVVRQKQDVYDIINNAFHRTQNWYELPHGMDLKTSWNLLWTWSKPQIDIKELFYFQKVNHFFGNKEIARKDLLKKNIERIKKLGPKAKTSFDIIPQTYFLPGQNMQFVRKFRQHSLKPGLNYWIMKPVGLSRGRGIELITKIQDVVFSEPVVIQKYLENPLLLDGHKFDMRIYVLVLSINPLEAFVYKEGFARLSTQRYSLEDTQVHNKFVHLTNFSVQKENFDLEQPKQFFALSSLQKQLGGCKITLKTLKQKLSHHNIAWQPLQTQIDSIVLKSLISTMNVIEPNPNCFQLFGYDIIIDENLKCWLIEVNSSPSLEKDFTIDEIVKQQLVDDVIDVVGPVGYDRGRLLEVVTRRRKELEGLKSHINTNNNSTAQLNADLHYILHGRPLRKYGQNVENTNFRRIAPGQTYQSIIRTVQQYKLSSITKEQPN